jgi:hypothetical protein
MQRHWLWHMGYSLQRLTTAGCCLAASVPSKLSNLRSPCVCTLLAPPPEDAAHSRSDDIAISRPMTTSAGTAMAALPTGAGGPAANRISAVLTMSLSATGSRKAPKAVAISSCRGDADILHTLRFGSASAGDVSGGNPQGGAQIAVWHVAVWRCKCE